MSELDLFLARTQARLAFFLIVTLIILVFGVMAILLLPLTVNQAVTNLLVQVITGILALTGTAAGFFYARMRPGGIPDASNVITQTHITPDGTKTVITSPATTPAGVPNATPPTIPLPVIPAAAPRGRVLNA